MGCCVSLSPAHPYHIFFGEHTFPSFMSAAGPEYSIIVPTYRRREPLARCLESIAALDYPRDRFEVVVVDDGSPTPPADLVADLDPSIDVRLVCARHAGPAAARNAGARFSRGRYLVFTDDDCAPESDWLAAVERRTTAAATPTLIGGRTVNVLADNIFAAASQGIVDFLYEYYGERAGSGRFFTTNNLVVPRAEFLEIGGFDEGFRLAAAEDRDLCERWRSTGMALEYAHDVVVRHAHALGFVRFSRQHFNYGRGAFDLHRSRARRGNRALRLEPAAFYSELVRFPLRRHRGSRSVLLTLLHFWSQVAYAAGYFFERVRRGWAVDWTERARPAVSEPQIIERNEIRSTRKRSRVSGVA